MGTLSTIVRSRGTGARHLAARTGVLQGATKPARCRCPTAGGCRSGPDTTEDRPEVLERRRAAWAPPAKPARGWDRIVAEQVLQADQGCDLAVLRAGG
jgi:hypothetical protein